MNGMKDEGIYEVAQMLRYAMNYTTVMNICQSLLGNREGMLSILPDNKVKEVIDSIPDSIKGYDFKYFSCLDLIQIDKDIMTDPDAVKEKIATSEDLQMMANVVTKIRNTSGLYTKLQSLTKETSSGSLIVYVDEGDPYPIDKFAAIILPVKTVVKFAGSTQVSDNRDVGVILMSSSISEKLISIESLSIIVSAIYKAWCPLIQKIVPEYFGTAEGRIKFLTQHEDVIEDALRLAIIQTYALVLSGTESMISMAIPPEYRNAVSYHSVIKNRKIMLSASINPEEDDEVETLEEDIIAGLPDDNPDANEEDDTPDVEVDVEVDNELDD